MMMAIDRAKQHSEAKLTALRARLANVPPAKEIILTCGSYARREASEASDIDFFVITRQPVPSSGLTNSVRARPQITCTVVFRRAVICQR
jgi:predicted nucleotidyltransferase